MKARRPISLVQIILCAALFGAFVGLISFLPPSPVRQATTQNSKSIETFQAQVIKIIDGDTITVRAGNQNTKIRLAEIDAPERSQPWGNRSREKLASLIEGKTVTITPQGTDRYDRMIAHISVSGQDVNAAMIKNGAAWAYRDYLRDQSLLGVEAQAKSKGVGLWGMPEGQHVAPWDYRAARRDRDHVAVGR